MTKVLSFAEWLELQETEMIDDAQRECNDNLNGSHACIIMDEPNCLTKGVPLCPLRTAYAEQRETDLQRWEKWNRIGDEFTGRLPSEEVL